MSDFDDVLERLLGDEAFRARLAADPAAALAGYRLAPDEVELLHAQLTGDTGGQQQVEQRTSKASLFGLLNPLSGVGSSVGDLASSTVDPPGQGFGAATPAQYIGEPIDHGVVDAPAQGFTPPDEGVMAAPETRAHGPAVGQNVGRHLPGIGEQSGFGTSDAPVEGYRTRVDADGDGRWDQHTYVNRSDGGVDIVVDANRDGRADFIGHDLDRDGLIDRATTDSDRDGVLDAQWVDDNGDGWLDRHVPIDPTEPGQAHVGRHRGPEEGLGQAR